MTYTIEDVADSLRKFLLLAAADGGMAIMKVNTEEFSGSLVIAVATPLEVVSRTRPFRCDGRRAEFALYTSDDRKFHVCVTEELS